MAKITSGTKEWATSNVNIADGCEHDCIYCYAKKMAIRFGRKTKDSWKEMKIREKDVKKGYSKRKGRVMFPSSHDITPSIFLESLAVLKKLLQSGNEVLIVTKPHYKVIKMLCHELEAYKKQILFRFTITSYNNELLEEYEPNAPFYGERYMALGYAYFQGFRTSVSIEPFLDKYPEHLIITIHQFVTDTIWLGKLNYMKTEFNTIENCIRVIKYIENHFPGKIKSKIRYKDSLREIKEKYNI